VLTEQEFARAKSAVIDRIRAPSEAASGQRTPKSVLVFVLGFVLFIFGLIATAGALLEIGKAAEPTPSAQGLIFLVLLGIVPLATGSLFCWRYLR